MARPSGHFDLQAVGALKRKTNCTTVFTFENDPRQYKVDTAFINDSIFYNFSYKLFSDKFIKSQLGYPETEGNQAVISGVTSWLPYAHSQVTL
jgi:hypothetical protein